MNELGVFNILAALAVVSAISVVLLKNPVISATMLILNLFTVACMYALMGAHFAAVVQVIVYAGAIMVLFLFVIMLLNLKKEQLRTGRLPFGEFVVLGLTIVTMGLVALRLLSGDPSASGLAQAEVLAEGESNTFLVGIQLFTKYLWPFELASFLILVAIIASIVIAKKEKAPNITKAS